jgi:hypothetical protein
MKTILISFLTVFCLATFSYSQNEVLTLTKKKTGKEKILVQGKKIKIYTDDGKMMKGYFSIKGDSIVILSKGVASVENIVQINRISLGQKLVGGTLTALGGGVSLIGAVGIAEIVKDGGFAIIALVVLAPLEAVSILTAAGGVIILVGGKRYKSTKWDYKIKTAGS